VCLEEPELGLHPDIIRPLAELLIKASQRMQLIVTTHSDALVDHLTDIPESVIVCEKEDGSTTLQRLDRRRLSSWLERYRLGELWRTGEIGGNRW
jgi:predicted ATPase